MLWDVDYTLVGADGLGTRLYEVVFREMFGRELTEVAPKAMTSPDRSRMGHISRPRNRSLVPRLPSRARPAVISSLSVKPRPRRCLVRSSQAFGE